MNSAEHDRIYDLIESYVFGNLEPDEYSAVEQHLETGCEKCLSRMRELSGLSEKLAESVAQDEPPEHLKDNILRRTNPGFNQSSSAASSGFNWIYAAAAVLVVALGIAVFKLQSDKSELQADLAEAKDVTQLLESPGMKFVNLEGVDPNPQAFGKVVLDPNQGTAVVYMYRLPQTPEGMEYQLWVMREGKPTSAGMFTVTPEGEAVLALNDLPELDSIPKFLVTIEPEGGMETPTGMMYLTGPGSG
ncbi:MAG: hypothetical protein GF307_10750 [candidate division Zixibacteria bacterium]|nr:hypothetical protein [candidate division Zixibacteria bacterium]